MRAALAVWADLDPTAPALMSATGPVLSRTELGELLDSAREVLRGAGLAPEDRVAVLIPQGLYGAIALLQVAAACSAAALRPVLVSDWIDTIRTLDPSAVVLDRSCYPEAAEAAAQLGIRCVDAADLRRSATPKVFVCNDSGHQMLLVSTSGSTGKPKWVKLSHAGLLGGCRATAKTLTLSQADRGLLALPLHHVHGIVTGLLLPLVSGGSVVVSNGVDPAEILDVITTRDVTWLSAPSAIHRALLEQHAVTPISPRNRLRFLRSGAAGMPTVLADELEQAFGVPLIEAYGMTECPHISCNPVDARRRGSVGRPLVDQLAITDTGGSGALAGRWGQIVVRGFPTMTGYLDPALDAGALREDWLHTGDEGMLDADGYLFIRGRIGDRINRGGLKVNPAQVEAVLTTYPGVLEAVAFAVPHPSLGEDLAAAVVPAAHARVDGDELRRYLAARLQPHQVPSRIVTLSALPVGAGGKPVRAELADILDAVLREPYEQPRGQGEILLVELFTELLSPRAAPGWRAGRRTNFFLDGGDSLTALRLLARLAASGWGEHGPELLFECPTPAALSAALGSQRPCPVGPGTVAADLGPAPDGSTSHPASNGQARLWLLHQLNPRLTAYHLPRTWRVRGALDVSALQSALTALVERHPALRTSFHLAAHGELQQVIHPARPFAAELEDLGDRDPSAVLASWREQEQTSPFDLTAGLLIRARLLCINAEDHLIFLNQHHIASDGWSQAILARDLAELYRACRDREPPRLPDLPVRYYHFAEWNRRRLSGERLDGLLAYWNEQLRGISPLELPTDMPRPVEPSHRGASVAFEVAPAMLAAFEQHCRTAGATLQMGLLALVAMLLQRHSGQDDIAIAVPIWGRNHPDFEQLIGFFVNTLPIRVHISETVSFHDLLAQVRATSLAGYEHHELPFDRIVEAVSHERDMSRLPLVQALVAVIELPPPSLSGLEGLTVQTLPEPDVSARFDLEFALRRSGDGGLAARIIYATDLFRVDRIQRLVGHLQTAMESVVAHPDLAVRSLDIRPTAECREVDSWQRGPDLAVADRCVHRLLDEQAERNPNALAVVHEDRRLTYAELQMSANQFAHHLIGLGVGPDTIVVVCLPRSVELIVSLLAILKAGGSYLPLDPEWPLARRRMVLAEAGRAPLLVATRSTASGLTDICRLSDLNDPRLLHQPTGAPDQRSHSTRQLAYVNFTSGSTGEPKGVMIEHRGILRLLDQHLPWRIGPGDRMLHMAPAAFDAATLEIWLPLLSGATLVLAPDERPDLDKLAELIAVQQISALWLTASLFHVMAEHRPDALAGVRRLLAGGEILEPAAVRSVLRLMPPDHVLINGYGPTESTTFASYHAIPGGAILREHESIPIGRPLPGTTLRVLDPLGAPCPIGIPGELFIGGSGLSRGYLNAPEVTATKFTIDPHGSGERIYRTGDLASWGPTGLLTFHGRTDDQIKIRGHRIDLAEIAATLAEHPAVARAVVVPAQTDDAKHELLLVGYWTGRPGSAASAVELRAFLADRLPQAMVPSAFVALDRIPLKTNGKLDRESLPEPSADHESTTPDTPTESRLHAIWVEILGHSWFGTTDNFFMVGGHSLQTVRLQARINEKFRTYFPLSLLIGSPTIRQQAQWLSGEVSATISGPHLVTIQPAGDRTPLIGVHGWGGTLFHFVDIARQLAPHRPFLGLQPPGVDELSADASVESLAATYAESIIARIPAGPIHLVGHSAGGWYAHAVAAALLERGRTIGLFAVFDSHARGANLHPEVLERIHPLDVKVGFIKTKIVDPWVKLAQRFRPPRLPVTIHLFSPSWAMELLQETWCFYALGGIRSHVMLQGHNDFQRSEHAPALAEALESAMVAIETAIHAELPVGDRLGRVLGIRP